jgi:hypothetical protein
VVTKATPTIGTPKSMLTVMWGMTGFQVVDLTTSQNQFNSQSFVEQIMVPLVQERFPHSRNWRTLRLRVHLDNCRVRFSQWQNSLLKQMTSCGFHIRLTAQI